MIKFDNAASGRDAVGCTSRAGYIPLMDIVYKCPECGNEDTHWGTAEPHLRVCRPPLGCNFCWRVPEQPTDRAIGQILATQSKDRLESFVPIERPAPPGIEIPNAPNLQRRCNLYVVSSCLPSALERRS